MDYATLKTRVERRVIDLPSAVQAEVPDLINETIRMAQDRHDFHVMRALQEATTTVSTRVLAAKASNFKKLRGRPWYTTESGEVRDLGVALSRNSAEQAFGVNTDTDDGEPRVIFIAEEDEDGVGNIEVFPYPDGNSDYSDGEYRISIPYWRYLADLSGDTDSNWFTVNGPWWVIFKATAEAFALNWDETRSLFWEQKAQEPWSRLMALDKRRWFGGLETMHFSTGAASPNVRTFGRSRGYWRVPDDLDVSSS